MESRTDATALNSIFCCLLLTCCQAEFLPANIPITVSCAVSQRGDHSVRILKAN